MSAGVAASAAVAENFFDGLELWSEIQEAADACGDGERRCVVAYVTAAQRLPLGHGDVLVVNAGGSALKQGATSKVALGHYVQAGVKVFSVPYLHAKVYVLGDTAVVGSANLSDRAASGASLEAAVISGSKKLLRQANAFIDDLINEREPMTDTDIDLLPDPDETTKSTADGPEVVDVPRRLWAYWTYEEDLTADELRLSRGHRGRGSLNEIVSIDVDDPAQPGDLLLPVWREDGAKIFGCPMTVLERLDDGETHLLIARPLDGYESLGVDTEHVRRRANLPKPIRSITENSDEVLVDASGLASLLTLFQIVQDEGHQQ